MKTAGLWILGLIVAIALIWVLAANGLFMYKVFAPAREEARRETFETSKAYRDGTIQELRSMQFEYLKTEDPVKKAGLANVIRHKLAGFPADAIPQDLQTFIKELP